jgi:hypothetical protein
MLACILMASFTLRVCCEFNEPLYTLGVETALWRNGEKTDNIENALVFHNGQRVVDVADDYVRRYFLNANDIIPQIFTHVCNISPPIATTECDSMVVSTLVGVYDISTIWSDIPLDENRFVYIRKGYSPDELMRFHCDTHNCPEAIRVRLAEELNKELLSSKARDATATFEQVYKYNIWGMNREVDGFGSGDGSSISSAQAMLQTLPGLLRDYRIDDIVDLGCGSMNWMAPLLQSVAAERAAGQQGSLLTRLSYTGVDASLTAIHRAKQVLQHHQQQTAVPETPPLIDYRFVHMDVTRGEEEHHVAMFEAVQQQCGVLPDRRQRRVLIIARHIFFHLPTQSVKSILQSLDRFSVGLTHSVVPCGEVYLLATNHLYVQNDDAALEKAGLGGYRPLNLYAPPFQLTPAIVEFADTEPNRVNGLWKFPLHYATTDFEFSQ